MNTNLQRALVIAAMAIMGFGLGVLFLKGLSILVPAVAAGMVGAVIALAFIKGPAAVFDDIKKTVKAAGMSPRRETDLDVVVEKCLGVNVSVRLEEGVPDRVRTLTENVIDSVMKLAPDLCAGFVGDELTYHVCRTGTYHLPRLLEPYLAVAPADRLAAESGVVAALERMLADLQDISRIFTEQGLDAARHRAKTVELKYTGMVAA